MENYGVERPTSSIITVFVLEEENDTWSLNGGKENRMSLNGSSGLADFD